MPDAFARLSHFLDTRMQMQHIYQPIMLEVLLTRRGTASVREVAAAILLHDESQLDYYEQIVKRMPGKVLGSHNIIERKGGSYALSANLVDLTDAERTELIARCRDAVTRFKEQRGSALWQHRQAGMGVVPGRVRFQTLKRAQFRCELCGVSADERALDVDHILPKSRGGSDEPENLQALCWLCNTNKGAGDATDFRGISASYDLRDASCPFCSIGARRVIAKNALAFMVEDEFPVSAGHLLVVPHRHFADYFEVRQSERNAIRQLLDQGRDRIQHQHPEVSGFNIGINVGEAAGQSVLHCHVHLIPRRVGDVEHPRGGVRGVIPGKASY